MPFSQNLKKQRKKYVSGEQNIKILRNEKEKLAKDFRD